MRRRAEVSTQISDDGWLITPYVGPEIADVFMGVSKDKNTEPSEWHPAFIDSSEGVRVAKIRPRSRGTVWLSVNGVARQVGVIR